MTTASNSIDHPLLATLKDVERYEQVPYQERFSIQSTYDLIINAAKKFGDDTALDFMITGMPDEPTIPISYNKLAERVNQTANLLHTAGVGATDAVSIMLPSLPQTHYAIWGSQAVGISNPINPLLDVEHIVEIMNEVQTKSLITIAPTDASDLWQKVETIIDKVPSLTSLLIISMPGLTKDIPAINNPRINVIDYSVALEQQESNQLIFDRKINENTIAAYFHTGGTTGQPKVAQLTHKGICFITQLMDGTSAYKGRFNTLSALPLFHIFGVVVAGIGAIFSGRCIVMMTPTGFRNPNVVQHWWHHVAKYKINSFGAVPTILAVLLDMPVGNNDVSCLESIGSGAAPLPEKLKIAFEERFNTTILNGYGMTETSCLITRSVLEKPAPGSSVGFRLPYTELCIAHVDDNKIAKTCETNTAGVVLVRGPHIFSGYLNTSDTDNAWATDSDEKQWFNTGDMGYLDNDGYLHLTGRAKDLIIRGGHNIDPVLIEEPLSKHPAVSMSVAIGQPDAHAGELPVAYVSLKPNTEATEEELLTHCETNISERAAIPKRIEIINEIPLTAVAKIFKPELRNRATEFALNTALETANIKAQITAKHDSHKGQTAAILLSEMDTLEAAQKALASFPVHIEFS